MTTGDSHRVGRTGKSRLLRHPVLLTVAVAAAVFGLIQLVPNRIANPPVTQEPAWNSPETRALAVRACFDCHSNQTRSPWYAKIAPISWWLKSHVDDGRRALNFSEWDREQRTREIIETVQEGSMPPNYFTWFGLHSDAKLTPAEKTALVNGLEATIGQQTVTGGGKGR